MTEIKLTKIDNGWIAEVFSIGNNVPCDDKHGSIYAATVDEALAAAKKVLEEK